MVKMSNKAHKYTDYMHRLTDCVHKIYDLHEYRLLTFPHYRAQIVKEILPHCERKTDNIVIVDEKI